VPRLVHVVRNRKIAPPATTTTVPATIYSFYLAPSGNDDGAGMLMIMVHTSGENEFDEQVEVFEVDVDGRRLIPKSTVGADRALFMGLVRALSISTKLFRSIAASANAVYFCHGEGYRGELFRVFHIHNGRTEPSVELEFFLADASARAFLRPIQPRHLPSLLRGCFLFLLENGKIPASVLRGVGLYGVLC
jgi:hypothetical protein